MDTTNPVIVTDTPAIRESAANLAAARRTVRAAVSTAEVLDYGTARTAAYNTVEAADRTSYALRADLERAVRDANPGASEADLNAALAAL